MQKPSNSVRQDEDVIDTKLLAKTLKSHKLFISIVTLLFAVSGIVYCLTRGPQYSSNLLMDTGSSADSGFGSLLSSFAPEFSAGTSNNLMAKEPGILVSRSVLVPTVKKLHLDITVQAATFPLLGGFLGRRYELTNYSDFPAPAEFGLSHYSWGGDRIQITDFNVSPDLINQGFRIVYQGNQQYQLYLSNKRLLNGQVGQTASWQSNPYTSLKLTVASIHARPGITFNLRKLPLETATNQLLSQLQISAAKNASGGVGGSSLLNVAYSNGDPVLAAAVLNTIAKEAIRQDLTSKMLQSQRSLILLKSQIPIVQQALSNAEQRLEKYQSTSGNLDLSDSSKLLLTELGEVDSKLAALQLQRTEMTGQYTPESFQIQQINAAITQITQQQTQLNNKLSQLPMAEQNLVDLLRNAKLQNAIYIGLMNKIAEMEVMKADTTSTLIIVDKADVPLQNNNRPAVAIIMLMALLGFTLSACLSIIKILFCPDHLDLEAIAQNTGLPLLSIHRSKEQQRQTRTHQKNPATDLHLLSEIAADSVSRQDFYNICTTLLFKLAQVKQKVLFIASVNDPSTQAFFSANLAQTLSESARVLLIDAYSNLNDLPAYFGLSGAPGLMELAQHQVELTEIIHQTRVSNLDFIAGGQLSGRHNEIILHSTTQEILKHCAERYDIVLVNTDFNPRFQDSILATDSGLKLLVLNQKRYSRTELTESLNTAQQANINFASIILTGVR